jgi:hypothetical protein
MFGAALNAHAITGESLGVVPMSALLPGVKAKRAYFYGLYSGNNLHDAVL